MIKEFDVPCPVFSASYLPERNIFVCGGEDFKMYKYEYSSGEELGKLHFTLLIGLFEPRSRYQHLSFCL